MARAEKTQEQKKVDAFARQQYQDVKNEQPPVYTANAEYEAYCNKRFAQEVSKFDANYFKAMTSGDNAPLSTSRLASPEQLRREADKLKASISGTGMSRGMWMGMMCLTPMLREGLTLDSVATIGGMLTIMGIGALVTMPDRMVKSRNKRAINKEISQLNRQATAKKYDLWCRDAERKLAAGKSLFPFVSLERSAKVLDFKRSLAGSAAKNAGVRIGMSEEAVGIAGVGILVSANKQMREYPDQIPTINRQYQENMATLYKLAAEDGITRENVQASIGRAYARVVDGIIQMEGEDCYNNPESTIHDLATGNGVKPPEMQVSSVERGSKEFVVAHKDGCIPYAKEAYTTSEREFIGDMKPFVIPTAQQAVNATRTIIQNVGKEFETVEKEAKLRRCSVGQVRAERFESFDDYIESALDGKVNPFTEDANNLAGALYSYEQIPEADRDYGALYDAMGEVYLNVCKDNVMTLAEYDEQVLQILTDFQSDISKAAIQCKNFDELEKVRQHAVGVSEVLENGILPQFVEDNPFANTTKALYDLQKEAGRAFEINELCGATGDGVFTAEDFVRQSEALYTTINGLNDYSVWPKEVKESVVRMCDVGLQTPGCTDKQRAWFENTKQKGLTPSIPLYKQFSGDDYKLQYDMAAGGYKIESDGTSIHMSTHVSYRTSDNSPIYNRITLRAPLPKTNVLDRLDIDRFMVIASPQYRDEGPEMVSNNEPKAKSQPQSGKEKVSSYSFNRSNQSHDVVYDDDTTSKESGNDNSYHIKNGNRSRVKNASADIIEVEPEVESHVAVDTSLLQSSGEDIDIDKDKGDEDIEMGD